VEGLFIVFEGLDEVSLSLQARLLRDHLWHNNVVCHLTSEPSSGPIGSIITQAREGRSVLSSGEHPLDPRRELLDDQLLHLSAADRHDHLYNQVNGIVKKTDAGETVICRGYYFGSLANHCFSEESFSVGSIINSRFPDPDLLIYIDYPAERPIGYSGAEAFADIFDDKNRLIKVKSNYDVMLEAYSGNIVMFDGATPDVTLHEQIVDEFEKYKSEI
jgi:dTMP kinase